MTTTFTVYNLHATMVTARSNFSILSTKGTGLPFQDSEIDLGAYRESLRWLLNYTAAGIPAPSSIVEHFWSAQEQMSNDYCSAELYQAYQSILAFPLWQFNPNNFGNVELSARSIIGDLPTDFYTKASLAKPYVKIVVNRPMFIIFSVLQVSPDLGQKCHPIIDNLNRVRCCPWHGSSFSCFG
jgi:hypothetical protein